VSTTYADFLAAKTQVDADSGFDPVWLPDFLFDFQEALAYWAIRKGRGALFADCGLGKGPMQLVWAENVRRHTGRPVLVLAPLAVSFQVEQEAQKFDIEAAVSRDGSIPAGITITNYERLHLFDLEQFGGVSCDESSILKSFDGERRAQITEALRTKHYRLLNTATAAPNDYIELGTSSEALGYLGHMDMLGRFFTNDQKAMFRVGDRGGASWRFKGHAEEAFWRWVSSWARAMRRPSDLGFSDDGFALPPLEVRHHIISANAPAEGRLFDVASSGLREEREELRRTLTERCEAAAELLVDAESAVAWCQLNDEGDLLTKLIDGAVQVSGSDDVDAKEEALLAFSRGEIRVLVTKPRIGAWGLNWQHCHRMTFFPSHSYEQWYQAVRRSWRFGQKHPVVVDVVATEGSAAAMESLARKAAQADRMFDALVVHMRDAVSIDRSLAFDVPVEVPAWLAS
jgi:hypothetical protein